MQTGFSADDSAKGVGSQTLVDPHVLVFVEVADAQVPPAEGVA